MSTNFPTSLDSYTTRSNGQVIDASHVNNLQDAVVALETKVGVTSSGVTSTLDYRVTQVETPGRCMLSGTGTMSAVANNTLTRITGTMWSVETSDPAGWHDPVTNNSRITVPTAGLYLVTANVYFAAPGSGAGAREAIIYKNGTYTYSTRVQAATTSDISVPVQAIMALAANDYLEIFCFQVSGTTLNVGGNTNYNWFHVSRLGT